MWVKMDTLVACAAAVLVGGLISAGYAHAALNLRGAEEIALQMNPVLRADRYTVARARGRVQQARLWPNPHLTASGTIGSALGTPGEYSAQVLLTQAIPLTARIARRTDAAEMEVLWRKAQFASRRWRVTAAVARAYYRVVVAHLATHRMTRLVRADRRLLALSRQRYKAAQVSLLTVNSAELLLASAQLTRSQWSAREQRARTTLVARMGRAPSKPWHLTAILPTLQVPPWSIAQKLAFQDRPDLVAARWQVAYTRATHRYERARRLGAVTVGAGVAVGRQVLQGLPPQPLDRALALSLSVPLPFWNRHQGDRERTQAQWQQAQARRRALHWQVAHQLKQDLLTFNALKGRLGPYQKLSLQARQTTHLALQGFALGQVRTATTINIFTAELRINDAYLRTLKRTVLARIAVAVDMGGPHGGQL